MERWTRQALWGVVLLSIVLDIAAPFLLSSPLPKWVALAVLLVLGVLCVIGAWQRRATGSVIGAALQGMLGLLFICAGLGFRFYA